MKKRIEEAWIEYMEAVVPEGAGTAQLQGTKMAFYAGASALLFIMSRAFSEDRDPTPEDLKTMDEINDELKEHARGCAAGVV